MLGLSIQCGPSTEIGLDVNYIELFAGCGGLSLGLKSVGFNMTMANELSPMAAESYAYNFLSEDLTSLASATHPPQKTVWLASSFPREQLHFRLRENPFESPKIQVAYSDLDKTGNNLDGALVVGSIVGLNQWLHKHPQALEKIRGSFGRGSVDLVSGGPPCQSFSMAGLRQKDNEKNSLPWEFAKFAESIQPKFVLLENVTGILRPFKGVDGSRYYAWFELAKAFVHIGYVPLCLHVNAKFAGVPQNRPRFILLGVRLDVLNSLLPTFNEIEKILFTQPLNFFHGVKAGKELTLDSLSFRDLSRVSDVPLFTQSFLRPLLQTQKFVSVKQAIDDLKTGKKKNGDFAKSLEVIFSSVIPSHALQNHDLRFNNDRVRRRFRLYQVLEKQSNEVRRSVLAVLKGSSDELTSETWTLIKDEKFLLKSGEFGFFQKKSQFLKFLQEHGTKKQTQKALTEKAPAPAALSIPDDACHYDINHLRTLTVREMARIQSFPDDFVFRSKVTTGGQMRRYEVPQYTQVGNAVPPLLGRALGLAVADLLARLNA
jgi:DNA (cytosine-5)-methyltransferase 1